jgi:signal transduction histidine kinase
LSTTVLVGAFALLLYAAMALLTWRGILPHFPTPVEWTGRGPTYLALAFLFTAFVVAAPTFYTAGMLRKLRDNERRLEARTHALIDAGKQKTQFMNNVTHELRTPLQGIIGLSDLVAKGIYGAASEQQRQAMAELKSSARQLLGLIDDLLEVARHDAGKLEVRLGEVAIATARWQLGGKQLRIELDTAEPLPRLTTDRAKVTQIVLNLLSNAIKFTPEGGAIVVRARTDGDGVRIEVADSGIGIAPGEVERIFDEFHQVDGSLSRDYGGVGLGLALVRRLLALIGGRISVESELGRGSTFRVWLPRA